MTCNSNTAATEKRNAFFTTLPDRLATFDQILTRLNQTLHPADLTELHRLSYNLAGAAGTFDAPAISSCARALEILVNDMTNAGEQQAGNQQSGKQDTTEPALALQQINERLADLKKLAASWQPTSALSLPPGLKTDHVRTELPPNKLLFLLEDDDTLARDICSFFNNAGYQTRHFSRTDTFESALAETSPGAILADIILEEGQDAGLQSINRAREQLHTLPPVVFISQRDDFDARLAAARAGASAYFPKPLNLTSLQHTLDKLTISQNDTPYRVLLVDDDKLMLDFYSSILTQAGMETLSLDQPGGAFNALAEFKPDIMLLDVHMPVCSGPELVSIIRQNETWAQMPIIFVSSEPDKDLQIEALNLGGDEFITKPVDTGYLINAINARARRSRNISRLNGELKQALLTSQYRHITLDQHSIVSIADTAGTITSVNDKFCQISGYSRQELLGQNHRLLKSGRHDKAFYDEMWSSISQGKIWKGILCNRSKSGKEYWVESTIVPFLDDHGKPCQYVSARTDITDLLASEDRLKRSQDYANIGTWDWNIATGELFLSGRIGPLFGIEKEIPETTYHNFLRSVHHDDRDSVINAVNACMEQQADFLIEHRIVWPDGSVHWVQESGDVLRDENDTPLHMLGVVQDIDQRKTVEKNLLRHRTAMDNSIDGIAILNGSGRYTYMNAAHAHIYGYDKTTDLIGKTWQSLYQGDELTRFNEQVIPALSSIKQWSGEALGTRRDESIFPQNLSLATLDDNGLVCIVKDITSQKENEKEIILAREEAESANRAKSQFLSSMSHELRTPLNAILGFGQLLEMEPENVLGVQQRDSVDEILKAGDHLLTLINEILDLSQIEAGRLALSIEHVPLSDVLIQCLGTLQPQIQKRALTVDVKLNGTPIANEQLAQLNTRLMADQIRLKQALLNLLSNAIKYNREQGQITIACETAADNRLRISITDTGEGLTEEQQSGLFTAFNRLGAEQKNIEGTGIGLMITKNIIELMAGTLGFRCTPGKGCTFWIELPCSDKVSSEPAVMHDTGRVRGTGPSHPPDGQPETYTVLYVEDNPANLRFMTHLLSHRPEYRLLTASDPMVGLEIAKQQLPDLIMLDINLPGLNGYETLIRLQAHKKTGGIPVIAISANAMPGDIKKGLAAGFDRYITKPVNIAELLQAMDNLLAK